MKNTYSFFLSFLLVLFCIPAFAQNVGTIKGIVTDAKTKETLIGANVVLQSDKSVGSATDFDGKFEFKANAGKYNVVCSYSGYTTQVKEIVVSYKETTTINFVMSLETKELGTVVVSAGKFEQKIEEITVSMDVIKPNIIENKNTTSMDQAIQQTPGVIIVNNEPQIRGGSGYSFGAGSRVMVLVDDLPLLTGDAGRPSWGFLPVENVEQIEVIKGASSVLYGSAALSGVINIRSAYPKNEPLTKINIFSGVYNNPRRKHAVYWGKNNPIYTGVNFLHSRKIGNLDFVIGGNLFKDDKFKGAEPINPLDSTFSKLQEHRGEFDKRARINFNLRYRSKKVQGLAYGVNGNFMYSESAGALLWFNSDTGLYRPYPGSLTQTLQSTWHIDPFLTYSTSNGSKHNVRTRFFHQNNNNDNNQANRSDLGFFEYQYNKSFLDGGLKGLSLTTGLMAMGTKGKAQLYAGNEDGSGESNASNIAMYLQLDKKFWEKLNVSVGTRYEHFNINDSKESKPVFRSGVNYEIVKFTNIRASFGQGFRFPTIAEKYILTAVGPMKIFPNLNLRSESSWNAEIGIKQGLKLGEFMGYLDVVYFQQRFNNNIEFTAGKWGNTNNFLNDFGFKSVNIGKTRSDGIDVSLLGQGKIGKVGINTLCGYTFMRPVSLEPDLGFDTIPNNIFNDSILTFRNTSSDPKNNLLKYRFNHLIKLDLEFTYKRWMTGASFRFNSFMQNVDKIFETLDTTLPLLPTGVTKYRQDHNKGDYVIDYRISYEVNEYAKVAFIVNNVLNREYAIRPLDIQAPRTTAIQVSMKF